MVRLGELLVAAGLLTAEQVELAVRAQVMWGGRIGTNLVELGHIDLDKLATALSRQHRVPAALGRHFERADPELQRRFDPDLAEKFSCIPLLYAGPDKQQIIVAAIAPLAARPLAMVADDLAVDPKQIIQSIAGELRIRYHLERAFNIPRGSRFLRPRGKTVPPFPHFEIDPLAFEDSQVDNVIPPVTQLDDLRSTVAPVPEPPAPEPEDEPLDDLAIAQLHDELRERIERKAASTPPPFATRPRADATIPGVGIGVDGDGDGDGDGDRHADDLEVPQLEEIVDDAETRAVPEEIDQDDSSGRERRRYVRTIDAPPASESERDRHKRLGRIALRRVQVGVDVDEEPAIGGLTLGEATRAIRRSTDRNRVAELVSEALFRFAMSCDAAMMLVIRGDAAMGWKGFCRSGANVPEIAVPLDQPGLIPRVLDRGQTCRLQAPELGPIDQLLLVSLSAQSGDLVVVPVSISGQVMCVIAMATQVGAQVATAESIAAAAGAAFARLMRNAGR